MDLKVRIPDEVYEAYVKRFGVQKTYQRLRTVIEEMKDVDPSDRYFIVFGDDRRAIEKIFQTTVESAAQLHKKVARLNAVSIEGTKMEFTSDELERIREQATFHGRSFEQFLVEMIAEIKAHFLDKI